MDMSRKNDPEVRSYQRGYFYGKYFMAKKTKKMNIEKPEWVVCHLVRIIEAELRPICQLSLSPPNGCIQQIFMK